MTFLRYLHAPPAPDLKTYGELTKYFWNNIVLKLGFARGATNVTLEIDTEEFLLPLRNIIHTERKSKSGQTLRNYESLDIADAFPIIYGTEFVSALQNKIYKRRLVNYLCKAFSTISKTELREHQSFLIDSSVFGTSPIKVQRGEITNLLNRKNNNGEADCAVWFHAHVSDCPQIIICANETDIWVYGLALMERDYFKIEDSDLKQICVEINFQNDYVNINVGIELLQSDKRLNRLKKHKICASAVLAIYPLSGSDY